MERAETPKGDSAGLKIGAQSEQGKKFLDVSVHFH